MFSLNLLKVYELANLKFLLHDDAIAYDLLISFVNFTLINILLFHGFYELLLYGFIFHLLFNYHQYF